MLLTMERTQWEVYGMGNRLHRRLRARALLAGLLCGLAGVAVDVDHLYELFTDITPGPVFVIPGIFDGHHFSEPGRPLHALILYCCCGVIAYLGGLLLQHLLATALEKAGKDEQSGPEYARPQMAGDEEQ